ncbi:MAG: SGNH/GDSL hydrolase family protein [Bacteroidota bacterium]
MTTFFILLGLIWGIGEAITRWLYHPDSPYFNIAEIDEKLGWKPKANFKLSQTIHNYVEGEYEAEYQTVRDGFRAFGNVNSDKFKVFFLGDSYTQSVEVSNHQTFYHLLQDSLPIEVFAFGMAGYGNLQEYLILEQFVDEIQPDLVVLQVCDNDFMDNHYKLGREAHYVVKLEKPFMGLDGQIRYLRPVSDWQNLISGSKFLAYLGRGISNLSPRPKGSDPSSAEYKINHDAEGYPAYQEAKQISKLIFDRFRSLLEQKNSDFLVMSSFAFPPQVDDQQEVLEELGITFVYQPSADLIYAKRQGENVNAADGFHWNPTGHHMIAKGLLPHIRQRMGLSNP